MYVKGFKRRKVSESLASKTEIFRSHSSYVRNHQTNAEKWKSRY